MKHEQERPAARAAKTSAYQKKRVQSSPIASFCHSFAFDEGYLLHVGCIYMFTGIIEVTAQVLARAETTLTVARPASFDDLQRGCSIAISGVCLTVTTFDATQMMFDVIPETWQKTKLGTLKPGDFVNLERALRADGRFDGHIVQGHCEGVGTVETPGNRLTLSVPPDLSPFIVSKGSITLDGVSLTVAAMDKKLCTVALIPETLQRTTLGALKAGDLLNIETDILGRYIHAMLPFS